jgi:hypothetical protein
MEGRRIASTQPGEHPWQNHRGAKLGVTDGDLRRATLPAA